MKPNLPISRERQTTETEVKVVLHPWGTGNVRVKTGVGFLDHMLTLLGVHAGFDLDIKARGDYEVDYHHTVEDVGIVLGEALYQALGERTGLSRYGEMTLPMEESLARVVVDLARRPCFVFKGRFPTEKIGAFDTELIPEFYKALAMSGCFTLHVNLLYGENAHHLAEASFKALGHALRKALAPLDTETPLSTKGVL
jgi:imidazoleglycerol-phosphate dehydratase